MLTREFTIPRNRYRINNASSGGRLSCGCCVITTHYRWTYCSRSRVGVVCTDTSDRYLSRDYTSNRKSVCLNTVCRCYFV